MRNQRAASMFLEKFQIPYTVNWIDAIWSFVPFSGLSTLIFAASAAFCASIVRYALIGL